MGGLVAKDEVRIRGQLREPMPRPSPRKFHAHGDVRVDEWHWLSKADSPAVVDHIEAENHHTQQMLSTSRELRDQIYAEICAFNSRTFDKPVARRGEWLYFRRESPGAELESFWRRGRDGDELLFDPNELERGGYLSVGPVHMSSDGAKMAYAVDRSGTENYDLVITKVSGRRELARISRATTKGCWTPDGHFFFVRGSKDLEKEQIWAWGQREGFHRVMSESEEGVGLEVGMSSDQSMVLISAVGHDVSETWYVPAKDAWARPASVAGRVRGSYYSCDYHSARQLWVAATDLGGGDIALVSTRTPGPLADWESFAGEISGCGVDRMVLLSDFVVLAERYEANGQLRVIPLDGAKEFVVRGSDVAGKGLRLVHLSRFCEFDRNVIWFYTEGGDSPRVYWRYNLVTRKYSRLATQKVGGGFDPRRYHTALEWARGHDGTMIPISIVKRRSTPVDGTAPCVLRVYGAYGDSMEQYYSPCQLALMDRGFVLATAHVRGGGELGAAWHRAGRGVHKSNTLSDTVACAKHLLNNGWSRKGGLCLRGGSAGGLAVGGALNMAPELFAAVVVESPFLDLLGTMMNPKLPLVVAEYGEWGNPKKAVDYWRLKHLSPYENVREVGYPAVLAFASWNDPFVEFYESLKWILRLRERTTAVAPLLVQVDMHGGHLGKSGKYENLFCEAEMLAFLCAQVGVGI
jgi:oligopeptidase B